MTDNKETWFCCGVITEVHVPEDNVAKPIEFGGGVWLQSVPDWVKSDAALQYESLTNRRGVEDATAAFVADYEADALGAPDPEWKGKETRSLQQVFDEKIGLAGLAVWLVSRCGWSAGPTFHFGRKGDASSLRSSSTLFRIRTHLEERDAPTVEILRRAGVLHRYLLGLRREGSIWVAVRTLMAALVQSAWEVRYILVWVALEALFGPEDGREITFRISQRIAFFIATGGEARDLFDRARECYRTRSLAVHGGRLSKLTPERLPTASSTRTASPVTSGPMPSPASTAMR